MKLKSSNAARMRITARITWGVTRGPITTPSRLGIAGGFSFALKRNEKNTIARNELTIIDYKRCFWIAPLQFLFLRVILNHVV